MDRIVAIIDQHVLRHPVVEKPHAELVIRPFGACIDRKEGKPDPPTRSLEKATARCSHGTGRHLQPDRGRNLNRVFVGRAIEYLPGDETLALTRSIDQQNRVCAREQNAGLELQGLRLRL